MFRKRHMSEKKSNQISCSPAVSTEDGGTIIHITQKNGDVDLPRCNHIPVTNIDYLNIQLTDDMEKYLNVTLPPPEMFADSGGANSSMTEQCSSQSSLPQFNPVITSSEHSIKIAVPGCNSSQSRVITNPSSNNNDVTIRISHRLSSKDLENKSLSQKQSVTNAQQHFRDGVFSSHHNSFEEREENRIVIYLSSCGILRRTFYRCMRAKTILETHMVQYDVKDLFAKKSFMLELAGRLENTCALCLNCSSNENRYLQTCCHLPVNLFSDKLKGALELPQIFLKGKYFGSLERLERLNETGELRGLLKDFPHCTHRFSCKICGGYKYIPCLDCHGSQKSSKISGLRCSTCDVHGLIPCPKCNLEDNYIF